MEHLAQLFTLSTWIHEARHGVDKVLGKKFESVWNMEMSAYLAEIALGPLPFFRFGYYMMQAHIWERNGKAEGLPMDQSTGGIWQALAALTDMAYEKGLIQYNSQSFESSLPIQTLIYIANEMLALDRQQLQQVAREAFEQRFGPLEVDQYNRQTIEGALSRIQAEWNGSNQEDMIRNVRRSVEKQPEWWLRCCTKERRS